MSNSKTKAIGLKGEDIYSQIHQVWKHKVMLSYDLAHLYDVEVKVLNQAVKRNTSRFPADFMFQLTEQEGVL